MAKSKPQQQESQKKQPYAYPSRFGSHSSMVDVDETAKLEDKSLIVMKDEYGHYTTEKNRIDNGLSDGNRTATSRLAKLFAKSAKEREDR